MRYFCRIVLNETNFFLTMLHILLRSVTVLALFLAGNTVSLYAQYSRLFNSDNELPNSLVTKVAETADDRIWIATEDGLCRFDGSSITTYRHTEGDSCSLANNFARTVCADQRGHLLVGTIAGVQMYRTATNDFTPIICDTAQGINPNSNCLDLTLLNNGDFLATGNQTFSIHIDEEGVPHAMRNGFSERLHLTQCAVQDGAGNIWVSKMDGLLYRLTPSGELITFRPKTLRTNYIALGKGPEGKLYASGEFGGVYRYNAETDDLDEVVPASPDFVVRDFVVEEGTNTMYLATDGYGVKLLDCTTGNCTQLLFDELNIDANRLKVHSIIKSHNGDIWMGLFQKGVYVMSRKPLNFRYFGSKSIRYNCVGQDCITTLLRASDGHIWVGTDNDGIYSVSDQGKTLAHFPCGTSAGSVPTALMTLFEDSRHRVWYGSYRQGGGILDLKTGHCTNIPIQGEGGEHGNIYAYAEDKRGQIWVATLGRGLLRYDEQRHLFRHVRTNYQCFWSDAILYDSITDRLYVGTYNGLTTIDLSQAEPVVTHTLDPHVIFSICKCAPNLLALCTSKGLILYDSQTGHNQLYTSANGLSGDIAYAAQMDSEGNLWVSGNAGLSKMNIRQSSFSNYTALDGLQGNEFYKNSSMRDKDGTLWFGGTNGITSFKPSEITTVLQNVHTRIVGLHVEQNIIIPSADEVYTISNQDHSFTIELATRPLMLTHRVQYRYSMDDDPWQTLPPMLNQVSFSHISSGRHHFRFQAIGDGVTSEVSEATIDIAYPWYRSTTATLAWVALALVFCYMLYLLLNRRRQEAHRNREHQQEVAINEAKLQFFMNIAHELRTPMTLIVSPLHKLMDTDKEASRQRSYQLMNRNANRILSLTNQLMDIRKIDKGQMQICCQNIDVAAHVEEVFDNFTDLAEVRKIKMELNDQLRPGVKAWIDPDILEKIITNLLSNAIKYTPEGGSIQLTVSVEGLSKAYPDGSICLQVTDTGIGISADEKLRIFDRFYRIRQTENQAIGTGIGLNLVQSLVALHHGSISVTDNPSGKGTCFTVHFPLGDSAYTAIEKESEPAVSEHLCSDISTTTITRDALSETLPLADAEKNTSTKFKILLVDDDVEIRRFLNQELSTLFKVITASNGEEALNLLMRDNTIQLVLSDVMMPQMDGIELCQRIRQNVRLNHLPVVLLTAKSTDEDRLRSLEIGASAFIGKPFNVEILRKTLLNLLEAQVRLRNSFSGQQLPTEQITTPELQSPDERLLQKIIKVINENLSNSDLTTDYIASKVGLSRVHLYRKLKELTNQSARSYIRNIRLAKAAELLSQKKMSVAEVAYLTGFNNANNFSTIFHDLYGMSPKEYMERNSKEETPSNPIE